MLLHFLLILLNQNQRKSRQALSDQTTTSQPLQLFPTAETLVFTGESHGNKL